MKHALLLLSAILLAGSVFGQGRPICDSIFPDPEAVLIPRGEQMHVSPVTFGPLMMTKGGGVKMRVTWDGTPAGWYQSPLWLGAYHFEASYKAYCRHEGHAEFCATSCFTFRRMEIGVEVLYTNLVHDGTDWTTNAVQVNN